jgi:hypothetical protein
LKEVKMPREVLDQLLAEIEQNKPQLPQDVTAKQLLQMVYRGEVELSPQQFNAAKVCLEYEQPKLTAVAIGHMDQSSFAAQLERCIERSKAPYVPRPALLPAPIEHSRDEVRGPFVRRRRNLR